jgi:microcystin-dependent protein
MADQFVAEVRVFPFNFPPIGWAFCNGQLLPISQNTALFSLIGTFYGGDGKSNFALPNMQGNLSNSQGQGPGLSLYDIGQTGGTETVTLLLSEMASHNHGFSGVESPTEPPNSATPANSAVAFKVGTTNIYSNATTPIGQFSPNAILPNGGNQPHNNMMPYLTLNFCIALSGIFPSRS